MCEGNVLLKQLRGNFRQKIVSDSNDVSRYNRSSNFFFHSKPISVQNTNVAHLNSIVGLVSIFFYEVLQLGWSKTIRFSQEKNQICLCEYASHEWRFDIPLAASRGIH